MLERLGMIPVDGFLVDLGVSSPQLDRAERGFSFRTDGPLDMRMDPTTGETAAELLRRVDEDELTRIIRELRRGAARGAGGARHHRGAQRRAGRDDGQAGGASSRARCRATSTTRTRRRGRSRRCASP